MVLVLVLSLAVRVLLMSLLRRLVLLVMMVLLLPTMVCLCWRCGW